MKTEFASEEVVVKCEYNSLKQAFINFMKNSIEAMPNGGELVIQMESINKDGILIRFIDQGCGIPNHILSKVGQPFYTTKEKGTGLGFMVSKKIIENHKGSISISSQENKGTSIEVRLPF
ncbi:ATP-binding protein [Bacillus salipaludis]|nr:ATP-binding protein [Bacillus salipaludis]